MNVSLSCFELAAYMGNVASLQEYSCVRSFGAMQDHISLATLRFAFIFILVYLFTPLGAQSGYEAWTKTLAFIMFFSIFFFFFFFL